MDDDKIRWRGTKYKSIIGKFILLSLAIIPSGFTIVYIIVVRLVGESITLLAFVGIGMTIITIVAIIYGGFKNYKKKIGYDSNPIYYVGMDNKKRELRFSDIKDIKVRSGKDSVILLKTKSDERVTVGPSAGGEFGRSLIEEYKRWIEENTDKKATIEFEEYDIPFMKSGDYVIKVNEP